VQTKKIVALNARYVGYHFPIDFVTLEWVIGIAINAIIVPIHPTIQIAVIILGRFLFINFNSNSSFNTYLYSRVNCLFKLSDKMTVLLIDHVTFKLPAF